MRIIYKVRIKYHGQKPTTIRFLSKENVLAYVKGYPAARYAGEEWVNNDGSVKRKKK